MTMDQAIAGLRMEKEQGLPSRFPCRAIMVKNIEQYGELLSELKTIQDIAVVSSVMLFSSNDVMPRYENLIDAKYANRWLILPGVSEYLRLFSRSEADTQRFAKLWCHQKAGDSKGRILIPLWGCEPQWHDRALHLCEDTRQESFYYNCVDQDAEEQLLHLTVLSGEFEAHLSALNALGGQVFFGLREWYEYWADVPSPSCEHVLPTKRYASIQPATGSVSIRVMRGSFDFIRESFGNAHNLTERDCPKEAQALLFDYALQGVGLDDAILEALNLAVFSGTGIMSRWETMGSGEKQLILLWLHLHPEESYLSHCAQAARYVEELPDHILHDIFSCFAARPNWAVECRELLTAMGLERDTAYFAALDQIPVYEERLQFLSGGSKGERVYLLRLVGTWVRSDPGQAASSQELHRLYPQLCAYLDRTGYDTELASYFSQYKTHKLENSLPSEPARRL